MSLCVQMSTEGLTLLNQLPKTTELSRIPQSLFLAIEPCFFWRALVRRQVISSVIVNNALVLILHHLYRKIPKQGEISKHTQKLESTSHKFTFRDLFFWRKVGTRGLCIGGNPYRLVQESGHLSASRGQAEDTKGLQNHKFSQAVLAAWWSHSSPGQFSFSLL